MKKHLLSSLFFISMLFRTISSQAAPGDLDPSFGLDGIADVDLGGSLEDTALDFALQADGKIIAAGVTGSFSSGSSAVVRFLPNGSLDPDFNGDGRVFFDLSSEAEITSAVEILADQSLLICGIKDANPDPNMQDIEAFLLKLKSNGDPDLNFGTSGLVTESLGGLFSFSADCLVQNDGKLLLMFSLIDPVAQTSDLFVARYLEDGTPDTSFGTNGKKTIILSSAFLTNRGQQRPDGKILVAGSLIQFSIFDAKAALVLLTENGDLDSSFGAGGEAILDAGAGFSSIFREAKLQSDGKIVAGGLLDNGVEGDFLIARFSADGILDSDFGPSLQGFEHTDISSGSNDNGSSLVIQPDNRIVLAGSDGQDMAVVRYSSDGNLDNTATFSDDGIVTVNFPDALEDNVSKILLQEDGKILLGGNATTTSESRNFALARLLADEGDLKVTIAANESEIGLNDEVIWTITVTNAGSAEAANVVVTSNAPEELAFVSASPGQGSCNTALPLDCQLGALAAGAETSIELTTSAEDVSNAIEFTVSVHGAIDDVSPTDNEATATISVDAGGGCSLIR